jgi:hypothetical protein
MRGWAAAVVIALAGCEDDGDGDRRRRALREAEAEVDDLERRLREEKRRREHAQAIRPVRPPSTPVVTRASLIVIVTAQGTVLADGREVDDAQLDALLRSTAQHDHTTQVVIQAERGTPHGAVVKVMEKAKAAGLTRLAIGTQPP